MRKIITLAMVILAVCLLFTACSCEHQYAESITKEPSCTEAGVKTFTCTQCSNSYTEEIPMVEHTFGKESVSKKATCTEEGEKSATCTVCGTTKVTETIQKTVHQYTSKVTTAATCTAEGVKTYTCSGCGDSYTESIAKASHNYTSKVTTAATCIAEGVKTFTCTNCPNSYTEKISAKGHDYSSKTTVSATCTSTGTQTYTCKNCAHAYTETINAKGHSWVDATCTKEKYCSRCSVTSGSALGHTTDNGTCGRCGQTFSIADQCSLVIGSSIPRGIIDKLYDHPNAPYNSFLITNLEYSFAGDGKGTVKLILNFDVEIIHAETSTSTFYVSIYNGDGKMVAHEKVYVKGSSIAGLCTTANEIIYNLKPGSYSIELSSN